MYGWLPVKVEFADELSNNFVELIVVWPPLWKAKQQIFWWRTGAATPVQTTQREVCSINLSVHTTTHTRHTIKRTGNTYPRLPIPYQILPKTSTKSRVHLTGFIWWYSGEKVSITCGGEGACHDRCPATLQSPRTFYIYGHDLLPIARLINVECVAGEAPVLFLQKQNAWQSKQARRRQRNYWEKLRQASTHSTLIRRPMGIKS